MNIRKLNEELKKLLELNTDSSVEFVSDKTAEAARKGIEALDYIISTYGMLGTPIQADELDQIKILEDAKELLRNMVPELQ